MFYRLSSLIFLLTLFQSFLFAQERLLDGFESLDGWKVFKSDGVELKLSIAEGVKGKALKFEYDFTTGAGYCGVQKRLPVDLSGSFRFSYYLKAESPSNNLEFKLLDKPGENVWWVNKRNYEFPVNWQRNSIKKRNVEFAWGPIHDKTLREIDKIEFTVASFVGGKGVLYIDELTFEELPAVQNLNAIPLINATANEKDLQYIIDNNSATYWQPADLNPAEITFDFGGLKEYGGIAFEWGDYPPEKIEVSVSDNNKEYIDASSAKDLTLHQTYLYLPESESRYVKLKITQAFERRVSIKEVRFLPVEFSLTKNSFISNIAAGYERGLFPRYFYDEKSYWTIIGVDSDEKEAMISEDGMIEVDKQSFSLEPFIENGGKIYHWANSQNTQGLEKDYLPIPYVKRESGETELTVQAFAAGTANKNSVLYVKYSLKNVSDKQISGKFHIAVRPFQVNPSYQFLNMSGGASKVGSIEKISSGIKVDNKIIYPGKSDYKLSLSTIASGEIVTRLAHKRLVKYYKLSDPVNLVSGLLSYEFTLAPGAVTDYLFAVPFYGADTDHNSRNFINNAGVVYREKLASVISAWEGKINRVGFKVPATLQPIVNTIRANMGYILINKDNYGIQPGSRSYERSWIRDGSLTSTAMMKMGYKEEIKDYIRWYGSYQFPNGKIPCVVDKRGPDPVPEHDSHGEFIFLVKNYFNFTKDTAFLKEMFPRVKGAVEYMNSLIAERSTEHFRNGNDSVRAYYGILTESISHEGYSDKPRHSYWDNFFAMKGFEDAVSIAGIINAESDLPSLIRNRDEFKKNLYKSLELAMKTRKIDYIPGCVELGDFDATSTTIALYPCNQTENLPQDKLINTFDKYYEYFSGRKNNKIDWTAYTPYENRIIGSYILLGQTDRAYELIDYFMNDRRPRGWDHWAEVVWRNERIPRFIGDMPHTWCGSDFINSARMLFAYEDETHSRLILGAGIKESMLSGEELLIENLPTHYGDISFSVKKSGSKIKYSLWGDDFTLPDGGIKIALKYESGTGKVLLSDKKVKYDKGALIINHFPAQFEIDIK
ncbi:MAG: discoidin domain-containing protein [Ignavibacteriaceae bacterium]|nr:discoidin domain-containing protein [Ignavibacteriaceae bacterium]